MNKRDFEKKLRLNWFNSLKEGQEIIVKSKGIDHVYTIINKDMHGKSVMVDKGEGQFYWYPLVQLYPLPEYMATELYKALTEVDIDE